MSEELVVQSTNKMREQQWQKTVDGWLILKCSSCGNGFKRAEGVYYRLEWPRRNPLAVWQFKWISVPSTSDSGTNLDPVGELPEVLVFTIIEINRVGVVPGQSASLQSLLHHSAAPAGHQEVTQEYHHYQSCNHRKLLYSVQNKSITNTLKRICQFNMPILITRSTWLTKWRGMRWNHRP